LVFWCCMMSLVVLDTSPMVVFSLVQVYASHKYNPINSTARIWPDSGWKVNQRLTEGFSGPLPGQKTNILTKTWFNCPQMENRPKKVAFGSQALSNSFLLQCVTNWFWTPGYIEVKFL